MQGLRNRGWLIVGVVLMLAAIFAYVASLDEADPEAAPAAVEDIGSGTPQVYFPIPNVISDGFVR